MIRFINHRQTIVAVGLVALAVGLATAVSLRMQSERLDFASFLLLMGAVLAGALALSEMALGRPTVAPRSRTGARVAIVTTCVMLVGLELALRFLLGTYATYLERNEGRSYELQYHHTSPARYHVFTPNTSYTHPRPEFAFPRTTNSLGLAEREIPAKRTPAEYRVIAVGDSYTEGVGTDYNETWLKVVERRLAADLTGRTVTTFNAGISGSDPWYGYVLLKDKLMAYRPDLVFVAINASDVNDVIIRGGRERFQADGTTQPRPTPWWEWLYGVSYVCRHVVHDVLGYNSLFVKVSAWQDERKKANALLVDAVKAVAALTRERGARLVIVFHPDQQEAARQRYERAFAALVVEVRHLPSLEVIDVLEHWKAKGLLDGGGAAALYWPIDGHNTPLGYAAFGEAVAEAMRSRTVP